MVNTTACNAQNSCKGKGWVLSNEKDCKAKGGRAQPISNEPMPVAPAPKK